MTNSVVVPLDVSTTPFYLPVA